MAEHLKEVLQGSVERVQGKRRRNQLRASVIKIATITFSGLATIFLGLQLEANATAYLKQAAFVLGACVTMLNALEPFFNYRSLWVQHERALAELYRIQADLDFFLSGDLGSALDEKKLQEFHARHQGVWEQLSESWLHARSEKPSEHK